MIICVPFTMYFERKTVCKIAIGRGHLLKGRYAPLCNHCFKRLFTKDENWEKVVKEQNDDIRKCMSTDYLETYGEILFGKK